MFSPRGKNISFPLTCFVCSDTDRVKVRRIDPRADVCRDAGGVAAPCENWTSRAAIATPLKFFNISFRKQCPCGTSCP
jgi:hypothetical protein